VIDQTSLLDEQLAAVLSLQASQKLTAYIGHGPEVEQLDFGIQPAEYDDGYTIGKDRPDFFSDVRVRKAVALCLDRAGLQEALFAQPFDVPLSYLAREHPFAVNDLDRLSNAPGYDPDEGMRLLDSYGWRDLDGDPVTPRTSSGVPGVKMGNVLALNYYTTQAPLRQKAAEFVKSSLAQCGIQVNIIYQPPAELFAPGPDGTLFGRKFDLAQFGWEASQTPPCYLYESGQIPSPANQWVGVNISGFSDAEYDTACQAARLTRPDLAAGLLQNYVRAQQLYNEEVAAIPLYYRLRVAVSRPDLCGMEMDISARSDLWNLEALDYGEGCTQ
jgi:peptide/nickel transport system substrate-binding protein